METVLIAARRGLTRNCVATIGGMRTARSCRRRGATWVGFWILAALPTGLYGQQPIFTADGDSPNEWFGHCVAAAGDINGDGVPDLVVGAPLDSTIAYQAGSAQVLSGVNGALLIGKAGAAAGGQLGFAVAGVGDANQDGFPDFAVGAPFQTSTYYEAGRTVVYSGASGTALWAVFGHTPTAWAGYSVAAGGDINLDGSMDVIVGASRDRTGGTDAGRVSVHSGVLGQEFWSVTGLATDERLGFAVSGGADASGDGVPDVAIGVPGRSLSAQTKYSGAILVVDGPTGNVLFTVNGSSAEDYVGESVDLRGDVDGDGRADVLFGMRRRSSPGVPQGGVVRVVSSATHAVLRDVPGTGAGEAFGTAVAYLGDLDQDGADDFAGGAPAGGEAGYSSGVVRVVSGGTGTVLFPYHADSWPALLGRSIARLGDLDQDGLDDFAVGVRRLKCTYSDAGRVVVLPGRGCPPGHGYGTGCPGSGGFVPDLWRSGCAESGALLTLELTHGLGGAPGFLFLGPGSGDAPISAGCSLLVAPPWIISPPIPLSGAGPGAGGFILPVSLPEGLPAVKLATQMFILDAGVSAGFSASDAVFVPIGG